MQGYLWQDVQEGKRKWRLVKMKVAAYVLAICFVSLFPSAEFHPNMRCLVESKSVKETVKRSTAVFLGEVVELKSSYEAQFRVEQSWKGVDTDEVSVMTDGSAECPHYRVGDKYLVFAGLQQGKLFTGACSRTKKLEYAQNDLHQLGEGKTHRAKK
jgi:hypothetical protein